MEPVVEVEEGATGCRVRRVVQVGGESEVEHAIVSCIILEMHRHVGENHILHLDRF